MSYDYGHHNCFHTAPLQRVGDDLMCPQCGLTFRVEPGQRAYLEQETR